MNDHIKKAIEFAKQSELIINQKSDEKMSIICLLSNEHTKYYYLDISRYFATIMYYLTNDVKYLTCDKKEYIYIASECNKQYPITKQLKFLASNFFKSFVKMNSSIIKNIVVQDTIDSVIIETNNTINSIIEHEHFYLGYLMKFKIKAKYINLYYRNNFSNMFLMVSNNNDVTTNIKFKLPSANEILELVANTNIFPETSTEFGKLIAQIRIVNNR